MKKFLKENRLLISLTISLLLIGIFYILLKDTSIYSFHKYCPFAPLCTLTVAIKAHSLLYPFSYLFMALLFAVSLFWGRFFCAWGCPVGVLEDFLIKPFRKIFKRKKLSKYNKQIRIFSFVFRGLIIARIFVVPFFTNKYGFLNMCPIIRVGDFYFSQEISLAIFVLGFYVLGSLFIERFFCRFICPLGLIMGLFSKLGAKLFRKPPVLKLCKKTSKCSICTNHCPMHINLMDSKWEKTDFYIDDIDCIACYECNQSCPITKKQNQKATKKTDIKKD